MSVAIMWEYDNTKDRERYRRYAEFSRDGGTRAQQGGGVGLSPETNPETCILCGMCARVCPIACIEVTESVNTDKTKCTACSACVQNCPTSARNWTHERILRGANYLATNHSNRKEPEIFL